MKFEEVDMKWATIYCALNMDPEEVGILCLLMAYILMALVFTLLIKYWYGTCRNDPAGVFIEDNGHIEFNKERFGNPKADYKRQQYLNGITRQKKHDFQAKLTYLSQFLVSRGLRLLLHKEDFLQKSSYPELWSS